MVRSRSLSAVMAAALAVTAAVPAVTVTAAEGDAACSADTAVTSDAIASGSHCTDVLGPAAEFETSYDWNIPLQAPGTFIVADPEAQGPVQAVLLMRGRLADGETDPEAWFSARDGVEVVTSAPADVGGIEGTVFDVTADAPGDIQFLRAAPPVDMIVLRSGEYYRIWWAQPDGSDAIVGFAPVATGDEAWLERADEIMGSLAISGDLSGPALSEPSVGQYTSERFALGSLSFELPQPADVVEPHPGYVLLQLPGRDAGVAFIAPKETGDGVALTDAATWRAATEDATAVTEGPTATILGQEVVGIEAEDPLSLPTLVVDPEAEDPFVATPTEGFGRDYLVDTDQGPLLVAVMALDPADVEDAVAFFDGLVESITLD